MPTWSFMSFQDSTSPTMEQLTYFHDHSMVILTLITILCLYLIISSMKTNMFNKFMMEGQEIETVWTIIPGALLMAIAFPSMKVLYMMEDTKSPSMTTKINGHQWYWSYEYPTMNNTEVDSFMENSKTIRLLKTSENLVIPVKSSVRALISSTDVIHSWTIPSMGVKVDAIPGRLNQTFISSKRLGLFSGQCSEICGANHSFMPTMVKVVTPKKLFEILKNT